MTREELYQLVWSRPTGEVARELGLSDVGLAKRCRRLGIPIPGRGYWARVAAGQTPAQSPLTERADEARDAEALTFDLPRKEVPLSHPPSAPPPESVQNLEFHLEIASPATKRTAVELKRPWVWDMSWDRGEKSGPTVQIEVSEAEADRAILVCERLLRCAATAGWEFGLPPETAKRASGTCTFGCLLIEGEPVQFRILESQRQVDHVPTTEEQADIRRFAFIRPRKWDLVPNGQLRLQISEPGSDRIEQTWTETRRNPLEHQIPKILTGFLEYARRIKARREEQQQAELEEQGRKRLVTELAERRRANSQLIHQLEIQAGAWYRARLLRAYVRALERANPGADRKFIEWALRYVDQLDPLSPTPHNSELKDERSGYHRCAEKCLEDLARLIGHHWQDATKIATPG